MGKKEELGTIIEKTKNELLEFDDYEIRVLIEEICHGVYRDSPNFNVKMLMLKMAMNEYIRRQESDDNA